MKKIISFLLAVVMVMAMSACTKAPNEQSSTTLGENTAASTEESQATQGNTTEATEPTNGQTEETEPSQTIAEPTQDSSEPNRQEEETEPATEETTAPTTEATNPSAETTEATEPAHTHTYTGKVTVATCTADGYTTHTCPCGDSYTDSKVSATGHSFGQWKTTREPTAAATGEEERTCSQCAAKETRTLDKLVDSHKHSYTSQETKAATCREEGVKTYTCSCGDTYTESIARTAHKYTDKVTQPTCTADGCTTHTCSECADAYSDTVTKALGHAYCAVKEQKATCSQEGYTLYECSRCKDTCKDNVTPAAGHDYDVISDTANCTSAGEKTEACSLCGDKKVTSSPAKGHGITRTETKDATTAAAGYTRVICTVCNGVISETTIPKLEPSHNCDDHMQRINCKNLKDGAVGIQTDKYRQYTSVTILACSKCGYADTSSMKFAYSSAEATAMIVDMINQLRYEAYGTHDYDVTVASHHSASEWAAKRLTTDFFACTPFVENIAHINLNGNIVKRLFEEWKNSPGHYAWMIDKDMRYFSLGVYVSENYGTHSSLVMWNKDELYLDNPNYTWHYR